MKTQVCMVAYTHYSSDPRVRREAEALASSNAYDVIFFLPKEREKPRSYELDNVKVRELNVTTYQGKSKFVYLFSYLQFLIASFFAVTKMFFSEKIDIVHVHNMPDFLVFSAIIPRIFGKKVILDVHDSMPETFGAKFVHKSKIFYSILCLNESLSCRIANKIICVNQPQSEVLIKRGVVPEKVFLCLNVPDDKRFALNDSLKHKIAKKNHSKFKLVYHGTLADRLGLDLTIHSVKRLIPKIPNIEFNIIGAGDDLEKYTRLTKELTVEDHVFFHGMIPIEAVPPAICNMDIGVVANRKNIATELMLPVKMMEYIALDIPVVAPRLKAIQYYFTEDMVSYFEPDDIDSLTEAIFRLYNDEISRNMQIKQARHFLNEYGWENHKLDLLNFYQDLARD